MSITFCGLGRGGLIACELLRIPLLGTSVNKDSRKGPQPRETKHLTLGVVSLYQPVAVEQDAVTLSQRDLSLLVAHPWHKPQRHSSCLQLLAIATMRQVRQIVACVSVSQASAVGVEDGVEAGGEHVGGDASQQRLVDLLKYLAWRVESKVCEIACSMPQVVAITSVAGSPSRRRLLLAA